MTTTLYAIENIKTREIINVSASKQIIYHKLNRLNRWQKKDYRMVIFIRKGYVK